MSINEAALPPSIGIHGSWNRGRVRVSTSGSRSKVKGKHRKTKIFDCTFLRASRIISPIAAIHLWSRRRVLRSIFFLSFLSFSLRKTAGIPGDAEREKSARSPPRWKNSTHPSSTREDLLRGGGETTADDHRRGRSATMKAAPWRRKQRALFPRGNDIPIPSAPPVYRFFRKERGSTGSGRDARKVACVVRVDLPSPASAVHVFEGAITPTPNRNQVQLSPGGFWAREKSRGAAVPFLGVGGSFQT